MMETSHEFELIEHFFKNQVHQRQDVILGIGDDAALVRVPAEQALVVAVDTLIESVHFPPETSAFDIAYKALAVNLSDLAAMGAVPAWATLALTLPSNDEDWLQQFSQGFFELANRYSVNLIGGDTTRGNVLGLSVQLQGWVDPDIALKRHGAQPGDLIYVSGCIGDAGLGLLHHQRKLKVSEPDVEYVLQRLNRPQPRVELGQALLGIASSAIDISDGLAADLGHVLKASGVGARVSLEDIPCSDAYNNAATQLSEYLIQYNKSMLTDFPATEFALTAGDDYELCFTVPPSKQQEVDCISQRLGLRLSQVGVVIDTEDLVLYAGGSHLVSFEPRGYRHF